MSGEFEANSGLPERECGKEAIEGIAMARGMQPSPEGVRVGERQGRPVLRREPGWKIREKVEGKEAGMPVLVLSQFIGGRRTEAAGVFAACPPLSRKTNRATSAT